MRQVQSEPLTAEDVAEFHALSRYAAMLRETLDTVVEELCHITQEEGDDDGLSNTVAWDVAHNGVDLKDVLRRCELTLEEDVNG